MDRWIYATAGAAGYVCWRLVSSTATPAPSTSIMLGVVAAVVLLLVVVLQGSFGRTAFRCAAIGLGTFAATSIAGGAAALLAASENPSAIYPWQPPPRLTGRWCVCQPAPPLSKFVMDYADGRLLFDLQGRDSFGAVHGGKVEGTYAVEGDTLRWVFPPTDKVGKALAGEWTFSMKWIDRNHLRLEGTAKPAGVAGDFDRMDLQPDPTAQQ